MCRSTAEGIANLYMRDGFSRFVAFCGLHFPRRAVVAGQPCRVAAAFGELHFLGLPLDDGVVVVGLVHEVAADGATAADFFVGDRLLARLDAIEEVFEVVVAVVEFDLGVFQVLFFDVP